MIDKIKNFEFLDEPATKWFVFLGMMLAFLWAWKGVLNAIKG